MGGPGRDLGDRLIAAGFQADNGGHYDDYDLVATMRSVIWTVAGVVLGIGLLALMVSAIDRASQRRKEVVALQLVGLGLGAVSGATYLSLDDNAMIPWEQTIVLGCVAVVGGLVVATVTMVACAPRLRPEEIRAE